MTTEQENDVRVIGQLLAKAIEDGWEQFGPYGKWRNPRRNDGATYLDSPGVGRKICEDYQLIGPAAAECDALRSLCGELLRALETIRPSLHSNLLADLADAAIAKAKEQQP